jgi:hypothetical protein
LFNDALNELPLKLVSTYMFAWYKEFQFSSVMCESLLLVGWLLQACHPLFLTEEVVPAVPSQQTTKDNGELY